MGNIDKGNEEQMAVYSENKGYLSCALADENNYLLTYSIKLPSGECHLSNLYTVLYKKALTYAGKTYDVQLNIKEIHKYGEGTPVFSTIRGKGLIENIADDKYNLKKYDQKIGVSIADRDGKNSKINVMCEYKILESGTYEQKSPKEAKVAGIWGISDLDHDAGLWVEGAKVIGKDAREENSTVVPTLYTLQSTIDKTIGIKNILYRELSFGGRTGTFFYDSVGGQADGGRFYLLMDKTSKISYIKTYDGAPGESSSIWFADGDLKRYHYITAEVEGPGKITNDLSSLSKLKDGDNVKVSYQANQGAYLKSITVDGKAVSPTEFVNDYTFSNITEDHTIKVVYGEMFKVTFDTKMRNTTTRKSKCCSK